MLSGFFGLIAMETSPALRADGSVIRTTCCAEVTENDMKTTRTKKVNLANSFPLLVLTITELAG